MLEPCPYCASTNLESEEVDNDAWMIECLECHATGPIAISDVSAAQKWNQRYQPRSPGG